MCNGVSPYCKFQDDNTHIEIRCVNEEKLAEIYGQI